MVKQRSNLGTNFEVRDGVIFFKGEQLLRGAWTGIEIVETPFQKRTRELIESMSVRGSPVDVKGEVEF